MMAGATSAMPDTIPELDRWAGVHRPYSAEQVESLQNTIAIEHTLANIGARRLWDLLTTRGLRAGAWSAHRQSSDAAGPRRTAGYLR